MADEMACPKPPGFIREFGNDDETLFVKDCLCA